MARRKTVTHSCGTTEGYVGLGYHGGGIGTVKQQVYDGDTIVVRGLGNFGVRFVGIDTAEMKLPLPGQTSFVSLADPRWEEFLADPFRQGGPLSPSPFSPGLTEYLQDRTGPGVAANHRRFAEAAEDQLEEYVQADMTAMGMAREGFAFYLRFAFRDHGQIRKVPLLHQPFPVR